MDGISDRALTLATFCHDYLKGGFTRSVVRLVRGLQGQTQDTEFVQRFGCEIMKEWNGVAKTATELIREATPEMELAQLFLRFPLNRLDPADAQWMVGLLRKSMPTNDVVGNQSSSALSAIEEITSRCRILEPMLVDFLINKTSILASNPENHQSDQELVTLIDSVIELHKCCQKLASLLSHFPYASIGFPVAQAR